MWKRIKENAAAAVVTVFIGFAAIAQFAIVNPIQQRFDAIDQRFDVVSQRFDAVEERIGRLSGEVSELRRLADRVSRNEGRLDAVTQQLQATGTPAPAPEPGKGLEEGALL